MIDTLLGNTTVFLGGVVFWPDIRRHRSLCRLFLFSRERKITRTIVEWVPNAYLSCV